MANVAETAIGVLNRCKEATLEHGWHATEELLDEKFAEHLWSTELEVSGRKFIHEFFVVSLRSGIVRLEMVVKGPDVDTSAILMAKFHFRYLSVKAIAAAMEAIIENH